MVIIFQYCDKCQFWWNILIYFNDVVLVEKYATKAVIFNVDTADCITSYLSAR